MYTVHNYYFREAAMGKRSVRENKNIYQTSREEAGLTREKASELMEFFLLTG